MKQIKLLSLLFLASSVFSLSQEKSTEASSEESYGLQKDFVKFTSGQKRFNDWSLAVYGGAPFIAGSDFNSHQDDRPLWGYDVHGVLTKQISHSFGLALSGGMGRTEQYAKTSKNKYRGHTEYWKVSLMGDVNFSSLFRRIDNRSRYGWSIHGYLGVGSIGYRAFLKNQKMNGFKRTELVKGPIGSMFAEGGAGLRYKLNKSFDIELKGMYTYTGDEEFDGSGSPSAHASNKAMGSALYSASERPSYDFEEGRDDGMWTASLGLIYKIGSHPDHLSWVDPLAALYPQEEITLPEVDVEVCAKGDMDNDAVCDDWDRQLNTPAGARVDGAGVALDTDLDGIIDLEDKCVTYPGPASNGGCPVEEVVEQVVVEQVDHDGILSEMIQGLEFALNSDVVTSQYYPLLNKVANYLNTTASGKQFQVIGHTDTRGKNAYNKALSRRRAEKVIAYLVNKGVSSSQLVAVAMGEKDLKYPECKPASKCPEWKNRANRRVIFLDK